MMNNYELAVFKKFKTKISYIILSNSLQLLKDNNNNKIDKNEKIIVTTNLINFCQCFMTFSKIMSE